MMAERVPSVRFASFTEPWEQRKFSEVFSFLRNNTLSRAELSDSEGETRDVHYGDILVKFGEVIDARRDELPRIASDALAGGLSCQPLSNGDVIIADTAEDEAVGKCSELRGCGDYPIVSGLHTMACRPEFEFAPGYLGYYMNSPAFHDQLLPLMQGIKVISVSKGAISDTEVCFPSLPEQKAIGASLTELDNLITLHQREHDRLLNVRSSLMQKMFPKVDEVAPSLRFSDYSEPWAAHKLGDLVTRYDQRVPTPTDDYVRLGVRSFARGTFLEKVSADQAIGETELRKVGVDNLIVNIVFAWEQAIAITSSEDTVALVSHRFPQFSFNEGQCPDFYRYALLDPRFKHHLWLASPSGAGRNKTLRIDEMLGYELLVPTEAEQRTIAAFFKNLDQSIETRQRECDALAHVKSALLQKMFV